MKKFGFVWLLIELCNTLDGSGELWSYYATEVNRSIDRTGLERGNEGGGGG